MIWKSSCIIWNQSPFEGQVFCILTIFPQYFIFVFVHNGFAIIESSHSYNPFKWENSIFEIKVNYRCFAVSKRQISAKYSSFSDRIFICFCLTSCHASHEYRTVLTIIISNEPLKIAVALTDYHWQIRIFLSCKKRPFINRTWKIQSEIWQYKILERHILVYLTPASTKVQFILIRKCKISVSVDFFKGN